jgi:tRNA 2-thiocytidine biosynthesis protein TtcA
MGTFTAEAVQGIFISLQEIPKRKKIWLEDSIFKKYIWKEEQSIQYYILKIWILMTEPPKKPNTRLRKKILSLTGRAIADFSMIRDGDRIAVCLSGGKDSWTMLEVLNILQKKAPIRFELQALHIDPGFNQNSAIILEHCSSLKIPCHVEKTPIHSIVEQNLRPGTSHCSFCARLRRGYIYEAAGRLGMTRIALGHHREDFNETILLNIFYGGIIKSMSPKMKSDNGLHTIIRPLVYVVEEMTRANALGRFPILDCNCPVCEMPNQERQEIKRLIQSLALRHPSVPANMLRAQSRIIRSHLLDKDLFNFDF